MKKHYWLGYSSKQGFVILDRTKPCNRPNSNEKLVFTKCINWHTFTEDRKNWHDSNKYVSIQALNLNPSQRQNVNRLIDNYHKRVKSEIVAGFKKNNVGSLWHLTHEKNIQSILDLGILNHYESHKTINIMIDISNKDVQVWRDLKEPYYQEKIHEYVPLFINYDNAMFYSLTRYKYPGQLCLIEISLDALMSNVFLFTDRNASTKDSNFFGHHEDLNKLFWNTLQDETWGWNSTQLTKQARQAEVLIYNKVSTRFIKKIYCSSEKMYLALSSAYKDLISNQNKFVY